MTQASNLAKGGTNFNSTGNLSLTTGVTGTLPVANGGTGLTALGTAGQVLTVNSGATALQYSTPTTTAPGGSTTQVQYNNAGAFAGSANFVFDGTNVGIGTSSPVGPLVVRAATASVYIDSNTAGNNANLFLRSAGADTFGIEAQSSTGGNNTYLSNRVTSGGLYFRTTNSSGTLNTQAAVDPSGLFQFNSGYGSVTTAYGCRAWAKFNGNGSISASNSGGVSSITRNGTGDYTVNLSFTMPDANYATTYGWSYNLGGSGLTTTQIYTQSTTAVRFIVMNSGGGAIDVQYVAMSCFR
jgi:hypothetical protein